MKWITGLVIRGDNRGKELGFPTANIALDDGDMRPDEGVYAAWVKVDGRKYMGAMHVGPRPTFDDETVTIEIHLLDFDSRDLYGEKIKFVVVEKIRSVEKFATIEKLVEAIQEDCNQVRSILR